MLSHVRGRIGGLRVDGSVGVVWCLVTRVWVWVSEGGISFIKLSVYGYIAIMFYPTFRVFKFHDDFVLVHTCGTTIHGLDILLQQDVWKFLLKCDQHSCNAYMVIS